MIQSWARVRYHPTWWRDGSLRASRTERLELVP